jgi:hypothetical protein
MKNRIVTLSVALLLAAGCDGGASAPQTGAHSGAAGSVETTGTGVTGSAGGISSAGYGGTAGEVGNTGSSGAAGDPGTTGSAGSTVDTDGGATDTGPGTAGSTSATGTAGFGGAMGAAGTGGATNGTLNATVAPGGNFDLSLWELQEPIGSAGSPTTISPLQLAGPNGFHDAYFFTDPMDGAMTFWDPEKGVTTPNSKFPRSELREMTAAGAPADWAIAGTHTLSASLTATQIPNHVCVGQIHLGTGSPSSTKPLLELFYYATGAIVLAIEQSPAGGNEVQHAVGKVAMGTKWSYDIGLSGNNITLTIDNGAAQKFTMSPTFNQENMYFKAGDYDQSSGSSTTLGAKVKFYSLKIVHGP